MKPSLKIVSSNVCGNKLAAAKLNYPGNARIVDLVNRLIKEEKPDILAIQEIPYASLGFIKSILEQFGYVMHIHKEFNAVKNKWQFTCLTVLFVKENISFEPEFRNGLKTLYRCVAGVLTISEQKIFLKVNHVPPISDEGGRGSESGKYMEDMLKRKTDFLSDELAFQQSMNTNGQLAISLGDYNCARTGEYSAQELFTQLPFVDLIGDEPTWNNAALDHIFVSQALEKSGIPIKHKLISYPNLTDHKILDLSLEISI